MMEKVFGGKFQRISGNVFSRIVELVSLGSLLCPLLPNHLPLTPPQKNFLNLNLENLPPSLEQTHNRSMLSPLLNKQKRALFNVKKELRYT